jgi:hypothetical protein
MLALSRAVIGVIGAGILVMTIANLTGGASIFDPVFPGGLILGASCLGAAAWTTSPATWQALVVWLGMAAVLVTITILGAIIFGTTDPSTYPYFLIPSVVVLVVVGVIAKARVAAGALGTRSTEG